MDKINQSLFDPSTEALYSAALSVMDAYAEDAKRHLGGSMVRAAFGVFWGLYYDRFLESPLELPYFGEYFSTDPHQELVECYNGYRLACAVAKVYYRRGQRHRPREA